MRRGRRERLLADDPFDLLFVLLDGMIASELAKELAIVEEQDLRNALQGEAGDHAGLFLDIDLVEVELALVLGVLGKLLDLGVNLLAHVAGLTAEDDQARLAVVVDDFFKAWSIKFLHDTDLSSKWVKLNVIKEYQPQTDVSIKFKLICSCPRQVRIDARAGESTKRSFGIANRSIEQRDTDRGALHGENPAETSLKQRRSKPPAKRPFMRHIRVVEV